MNKHIMNSVTLHSTIFVLICTQRLLKDMSILSCAQVKMTGLDLISLPMNDHFQSLN